MQMTHPLDANGRRTILIVDDNAAERAVLEGFLREAYDVAAANGGEEALSILTRDDARIAAVILDIVMPEMDGYAVMKRLRETSALSHIPVIVNTGMEDDETRKKAIACGASGFITRPYNRALLLHTIANAVRLRDMAAAAEQTRAEQLQRKLLDNLPGGAALYEYDGERIKAVHINKSYWKLVGRAPQDYASLSVLDAIHPEDRETVEREVGAAIREGRSAEADIRVRSGAAGYRPFHVTANVMAEPGGKYALYVSYMPITKERRLSFELDALLNTIPSGVLKYAADEGEQFAYINRRFVESLGYTPESFKDKFHNCFREMIWHEDREWAEAEVIKQEGGGEIGKFDYRVEAADGTLRWIHDEGVKITDQEGNSWYYVTLFDITEQQKALEKLRVSEEINRIAMRHSDKIVTQFNVEARTLTLPDSLTPIYEVPHLLKNMPEEQIALRRVSPETADDYRDLFERIIAGSPEGTGTFQQHSTMGWRWLEAYYTTVFSDDGKPLWAVVTFDDVTETLEKEVVYSKWQQSLTDRPKSSYTLFRCNLSKDAYFDSCEGTLLDIGFANDKRNFGELTTGYVRRHVYEEDREKYLAFLNSDALLAGYYRGHRADSLEYREIQMDGSLRWLHLSVELVEYPNSKDIEVYLMYEDINESKLETLRTREKAETDPLTGVLNRTTFIARMEEIIAASKPGESHALLMMDVDDFKHVNDTFGHDAGDRVLLELTERMRGTLRRDDLIGRLGGDEFLIFLRDIPDAAVAGAKAGRICSLPVSVAPGQALVTLSAGVAMIPKDGLCFDALYKAADDALYRQKKSGKNGFCFVEPQAISKPL